MATRTLTFKTTDFTQDVNLLLAFVPQTTDAFIKRSPVAWRVATLSGRTRSQFSVSYTNTLGVSVAQVGVNNTVVAGNYAPIHLGQETTLEADNASRPPVYIFSEPTATTSDVVKVTNLTGQPTDIGFGFISNPEQPNESMNITSIYQNVSNGIPVIAERPYLLRAYVGLNYRESEILGREILNTQPIWEGDLLTLQPLTTILLTGQRVATGYNSSQLGSTIQVTIPQEVVEIPRVRFEDQITSSTRVVSTPEIITTFEQPRTTFENEKVYSATLAFATPDMVVPVMKNIVEYLINQSFQVKFTYSEGTTEAAIDLTLPYSTCCDQAEKEVLAAIDTQIEDTDKARIVSRSGSQMVSSGRNFNYWVKINPASADWFNAQRFPASPSRVRYVPSSPRFLTPTVPTTSSYFPKNRLLTRRVSSASLNGF